MKKQRPDYKKRLKLRKPDRSCEWCGVECEVDYCSDECLQADMGDIEDQPPITVWAYGPVNLSWRTPQPVHLPPIVLD